MLVIAHPVQVETFEMPTISVPVVSVLLCRDVYKHAQGLALVL